MKRRPNVSDKGYRYVVATPEEVAAYLKRHPGYRTPAVRRIECERCGKRIWGSGMAVGSHDRACPGKAPASLAIPGDVVRRPDGVIEGVVTSYADPERAIPGSVWVRWDSGAVLPEDPAKLVVLDRP